MPFRSDRSLACRSRRPLGLRSSLVSPGFGRTGGICGNGRVELAPGGPSAGDLGIIALDVPDNRMFVTYLGGSVYAAKLDDFETRAHLYAQGGSKLVC
jgi:hypothetical protein